MIELQTQNRELRTPKGFTLIELLVVLGIFSIVMAGLYSAYSVQMKAGVKEYKLAESEMEFQIAKLVIERDLAMAGYGIADTYSAVTPTFSPRVVAATDGNPDTLTIVGTALGRDSRATQAWSYTMIQDPATAANFYPFSSPSATYQDARENLRTDDMVVYMNPTTRNLLALPAGTTNSITGKSWLFPFPPSGANPRPNPLDNGILAYGLQTKPSGTASYADNPYYTVGYSATGTPPSYCAPLSKNLMRSETRMNDSGNPQPLINCVLDFEVALGIDKTEDGLIDCWDNGGVTEAAGYSSDVLRTRLKQIKVYILVQQGSTDPNYTSPDTIRVGDASLTSCTGTGVGRLVTFTAAQKNYRWKVLSLSVTPRNIR